MKFRSAHAGPLASHALIRGKQVEGGRTCFMPDSLSSVSRASASANSCRPRVTATVVASSSRFDIECREVGLVGMAARLFFLSLFLGGQVWIARLGSPMVAIACLALQMAIILVPGMEVVRQGWFPKSCSWHSFFRRLSHHSSVPSCQGPEDAGTKFPPE